MIFYSPEAFLQWMNGQLMESYAYITNCEDADNCDSINEEILKHKRIGIDMALNPRYYQGTELQEDWETIVDAYEYLTPLTTSDSLKKFKNGAENHFVKLSQINLMYNPEVNGLDDSSVSIEVL